MSLLQLRDAIVAQLPKELPALRFVEPHGGRFDAGELKRWALKSPACLVACLGCQSVTREGGEPVGAARFVIFFVTRGSSKLPKEAAALVFIEQIAAIVARNKWDYENAQAPMDVRIDNLYSGQIDKLGVALWSVTWSQAVDLDIQGSAALEYLNEAYVDWEIEDDAEQIDAQDIVDLT